MAWCNTGIRRIILDPAPDAEPARPIETPRAAWIAIDKLAAILPIAPREFLNFKNHECRRLAAFGLVMFQI
jgi:hypothetical protein